MGGVYELFHELIFPYYGEKLSVGAMQFHLFSWKMLALIWILEALLRPVIHFKIAFHTWSPPLHRFGCLGLMVLYGKLVSSLLAFCKEHGYGLYGNVPFPASSPNALAAARLLWFFLALR